MTADELLGLLDSGRITGASYAGDPRPGTAMFVTRKVEGLLENLEGMEGCLLFVEDGVHLPGCVRSSHIVVESSNPQLDYARFAQELLERGDELDRECPPALTEAGYFLAPTARVAADARIEPGAVIYNDVEIRGGAMIRSGAVVRHADIGEDAVIKSNACIGDQGFNFAHDEEGSLLAIPCLGRARIGRGAEVGCSTTVCRGMAGDTVLGERTKVDDHVHVGHDVRIGRDTEVTAGTVIGGYCDIGAGCFIGLNSTLKNRIRVGDGAFVAMGAAVVRDVPGGTKVFGSPAKPMRL